MKRLLFFLADSRQSLSLPIAATLAWMAREKEMDFGAYFVGRAAPETVRNFFPQGDSTRNFIDAFLTLEDLGLGWMGGVAPFRESHIADLYSVLNCCDVVGCTNASEARRFLNVLGNLKHFVAMKKGEAITSFYRDVFSLLGIEFPKTAIIVPSTPFGLKKQLLIENYCYPDIFYSKKLGLDSSVSEKELTELKKSGLTEIDLLYCSENTIQKLEPYGFKTRIIDTLKQEDTYGAVTQRIFSRWKNHSKGVSYSDPLLTLYWTPFYCLNDLIAMFDLDWKSFAPTIAECASTTNSKVIYGRQLADDFIPLLSKHDKIFAIIDANRPSVTIKNKMPYTPAAIDKTPWSMELSDEQIGLMVSQGKIPVTTLLYASDIRHLTIAPSLFPLASLMRVKVGVAVPINFYEYVPEWMDDLYIQYEAGGSMPYVEPMICSAGLGVATEAEGYLSAQTLTESLKKTRKWISEKWGASAVPIGYYPFQDACPFYKHDTAEPQFEAVRSADFEYYITYKDEGKLPRIVYEKEDFIAINQQNVHWTRNPLEDLKSWEQKILNEGKLGWIIISLDAPFWGFMFYEMKSGRMLIDTMDFIRKGGESGRLCSATPHEIVRYAKVLKASNKP